MKDEGGKVKPVVRTRTPEASRVGHESPSRTRIPGADSASSSRARTPEASRVGLASPSGTKITSPGRTRTPEASRVGLTSPSASKIPSPRRTRTPDTKVDRKGQESPEGIVTPETIKRSSVHNTKQATETDADVISPGNSVSTSELQPCVASPSESTANDVNEVNDVITASARLADSPEVTTANPFYANNEFLISRNESLESSGEVNTPECSKVSVPTAPPPSFPLGGEEEDAQQQQQQQQQQQSTTVHHEQILKHNYGDVSVASPYTNLLPRLNAIEAEFSPPVQIKPAAPPIEEISTSVQSAEVVPSAVQDGSPLYPELVAPAAPDVEELEDEGEHLEDHECVPLIEAFTEEQLKMFYHNEEVENVEMYVQEFVSTNSKRPLSLFEDLVENYYKSRLKLVEVHNKIAGLEVSCGELRSEVCTNKKSER